MAQLGGDFRQIDQRARTANRLAELKLSYTLNRPHRRLSYMALNFLISFSGIVTFKNAGDLKQVATKIPLEKLLIETDSPYLAPVPFRGKENTPAYVRYVAEHLAELREDSIENIATATTSNFYKLFSGAA